MSIRCSCGFNGGATYKVQCFAEALVAPEHGNTPENFEFPEQIPDIFAITNSVVLFLSMKMTALALTDNQKFTHFLFNTLSLSLSMKRYPNGPNDAEKRSCAC